LSPYTSVFQGLLNLHAISEKEDVGDGSDVVSSRDYGARGAHEKGCYAQTQNLKFRREGGRATGKKDLDRLLWYRCRRRSPKKTWGGGVQVEAMCGMKTKGKLRTEFRREETAQ